MSDFIEEIRCALAMREAGYDALLGHEATAELLRRHDVMVKALEAALVIAKQEWGFPGAHPHRLAVMRDMEDALAVVGNVPK